MPRWQLAQLPRGGMTVLALAEAAQTTSDNAAANLLLGLIGGPAGFTALMREAGDSVTRLDRLEPQMNLVVADDPRDTTTPLAMSQNTAHWLTGGGLQPASKALLIDWMVATRTGSKRLRAGLPPRWRAGDKTGTAMADGMTDKYNDVAITWPAPVGTPRRGPGDHQRLLRDRGRPRRPDARRRPGRAGRSGAHSRALGARGR